MLPKSHHHKIVYYIMYFVLCFAEPETPRTFRGSNVFMCCVVIVMHELLVSCITLAQGTSTSPSCFLRRRRPRCVVVVVAVVAFLCRRGLLRCVAVALVVVVVWVD